MGGREILLMLGMVCGAFFLGDCYGVKTHQQRSELRAAADSVARAQARADSANAHLAEAREQERRARQRADSIAAAAEVAIAEWEIEAVDAQTEAADAQARLDSLFADIGAPEALIAAHQEVVAQMQREIDTGRARERILRQQLESVTELASQRLAVMRDQQNTIYELENGLDSAERALSTAIAAANPGFFSMDGGLGDVTKVSVGVVLGIGLAAIANGR